jgi:hypothetical protein
VGDRSLTPAELSERWSVPLSTLAHWRSLVFGPAYLRMRGIVRYRVRDVEDYETANLMTPGGVP